MDTSGNLKSSNSIAILKNAAQCNNCGEYLCSDNSHSGILWCKCGLIGISGGTEEIRRVGDPTKLIELSEELFEDGSVRRVADRRYADVDGTPLDGDEIDPEIMQLCEGANGEEWRELDEQKLKNFRKLRRWQQYPPAVEFVVEFPDVDRMKHYDPKTGDGIVDAEMKFTDLDEAVIFARSKCRQIAMMPINKDNKLADQVALYKREVTYIPFMGRAFLPDDQEKVICPQCEKEVERYQYDSIYNMCNVCIAERTKAVLIATNGYSKWIPGKPGLRHSSELVEEAMEDITTKTPQTR